MININIIIKYSLPDANTIVGSENSPSLLLIKKDSNSSLYKTNSTEVNMIMITPTSHLETGYMDKDANYWKSEINEEKMQNGTGTKCINVPKFLQNDEEIKIDKLNTNNN